MLSGDIVLSTAESLLSGVIRYGINSKWSHTSLLLWVDDNGVIQLGPGQGNKLCILNIGGRREYDVIKNRVTGKVRVVRLSNLIEDQYSLIGIARLRSDIVRNDHFLGLLRIFIKRYTDKPRRFGMNRAYLHWSGLAAPPESETEIYCSELIGYYIQQVLEPFLDRIIIPKGKMVNAATIEAQTDIFQPPQIIYKNNALTVDNKFLIGFLLLIIILAIMALIIFYRPQRCIARN